MKIVFFFFLFLSLVMGIHLISGLMSGDFTFDIRALFALGLPLLIVILSGRTYILLRKVEALKTRGRKVEAHVTDIVIKQSILQGQRYQVFCEWVNPENNVKHNFKSYVFGLPAGYTVSRSGVVDVYVDDNYHSYFVEPKKIIN